MVKKLLVYIVIALILLGFYLSYTGRNSKPESEMIYGASFTITRSDDLGLNWKEVYRAMLDDLKVRKLRLAALWPLIEKKEGTYNFADLDYQMQEAAKHNATVILAVGRRLPGYPECHDPIWLSKYSPEKQDQLKFDFVSAVVKRYKSSSALLEWQVENEPFFDIFTRSRSLCPGFDAPAFAKEVSLARSIDPNHRILVTDAGELGTWFGAYRAGDTFGTSMYLYVWNRVLGYIRYPILPSYFRIKHGLMRLFYGDKPAIVVELQSEPWIPRPLKEVPIDEQLTRFNMDKMNEMISYAYKGGFDEAYLWGAEWWYWMKLHNHPEFWQRGKQLFAQ